MRELKNYANVNNLVESGNKKFVKSVTVLENDRRAQIGEDGSAHEDITPQERYQKRSPRVSEITQQTAQKV